MTDRLAHDLPVVAALVAIGLGWFLVFDVCARFSYRFSDRALILRCYVLRDVPWARRTIPFGYILEARSGYHPGLLGLKGQLFGHFFKKGVITIILRRRVVLVKRYYITPEEPPRFLADLRRYLPPRATP